MVDDIPLARCRPPQLPLDAEGVERRRHRRGVVPPLEIEVLGVGGKVAAVSERGLFVERVGGKNRLQVALVQAVDDLDDLH